MARTLPRLIPAALLVLASAAARAQSGTISGAVRDSATRAPLAGARVQAVGPASASTTTREDGTYRLGNLAAGSYTVTVTRIGYGLARRSGVQLAEGGSATADFSVHEIVAELNPVVTTASRKPEKALDAPASVSVVDVREITERPSATVVDHIRAVPGVDVSQGGIAQSNVVARGFNGAFSGSLLTLQDYRFAAVPSLRVNSPFLFTSVNEDIERIEVLLGPASALYGPNSANGVLHIITKSPFTSQGTTLTLDGGQRSLLRGAFRQAGATRNEKVGYKVSGEYFTANDFQSFSGRDTTGAVIPRADPGEPDVFPAEAPAGRRGQPNDRDFDLRRFAGEARVDLRPTANSEFVTTYGYTRILDGTELTGANGTSQVRNWTYQSIQQRMRVGRLFGQLFANLSDAGNDDSLDLSGTFLLRSGQPIVDKSRVFAAQLQHGVGIGSRQDFVYGLDYIFTNPRTGNTINGRNEDDDDVREIGGYVQSTTNVSRMFDVVLAARLDNNDRIAGNQFSPRAALIFKPTATQNFRVTYNRAFSTPANFSYFLDLIQSRNIGGSGYNIRALGNPPKQGWQFNRSCGGVNSGLCMKSIFASTSNTWVPASAAAAYPGVINALSTQLVQALTPTLGAARAQQIVAFLGTLRPTDAQVGSRIAFLNLAVDPTKDVDPARLRDIGPLDAAYNKTIELGYKGIIGDRLRIAVDAWHQRRGDVGNPAGLATPNVFFNGQSLGAYLGPNIAQALVAAGLPQAQAAAAAQQIAAQIATRAAPLPVGIVQFDSDQFANGRDLYATYTSQTDKEITVRGIDLAVDLVATNRWTLAGTYSWMSDVIFENVPSSNGLPLMLNSPDHKGSLTLRYRDEPRRYGVEVRGRYTNAYPVNSGVYATGVVYPRPGTATAYVYDGIPVGAFLDLGVNYRFPRTASGEILWSLNATNVLDNQRRALPGAAQIGRLVVTRIQYSF